MLGVPKGLGHSNAYKYLKREAKKTINKDFGELKGNDFNKVKYIKR